MEISSDFMGVSFRISHPRIPVKDISPGIWPGPPQPWLPREPPTGARLAAGEAGRRALAPLSLFDAGRTAHAENGRAAPALLDSLRSVARGAWHAAQAGLRPVSETPLNRKPGPHRRFDWTRLPLDEVKRIGRDDVLDMIGIELGPVRLKCALLALKTIKAGVYGLPQWPGEAEDEEAGGTPAGGR